MTAFCKGACIWEIKYDFYRQNAEISCCFLRTFHDKNTKLAHFSFILFLLNRAAVW